MKKMMLLVVALAACDPGPVTFSIIPKAQAAIPNQVLQLALSQAAPGVVWSATAGTITSTGLFTAPGCAASMPFGVTITATSGSFTSTATVAVNDAVTGITVNPPTASVVALGSMQFTASVRTICNPTGIAAVLGAPVRR